MFVDATIHQTYADTNALLNTKGIRIIRIGIKWLILPRQVIFQNSCVEAQLLPFTQNMIEFSLYGKIFWVTVTGLIPFVLKKHFWTLFIRVFIGPNKIFCNSTKLHRFRLLWINFTLFGKAKFFGKSTNLQKKHRNLSRNLGAYCRITEIWCRFVPAPCLYVAKVGWQCLWPKFWSDFQIRGIQNFSLRKKTFCYSRFSFP